MKHIKISGRTGECDIILGESIYNLEKYVDAEKAMIVTDRNVRSIHGNSFPDLEVIEIGKGEESKTLDAVRTIYKKFLGLDRFSFVIGIGGGVVCDLTGFSASTFLRGLRFGFVPTTLLAQADASIGGKNGVNFMGYKNLIGVFSQPRFVLCDFELLKTLPESGLRCGFAEIVKHAVIGNPALFLYLEKHWREAFSLERKAIEHVVSCSVLVKTGIVSRDEIETGERMKLNFGHTIGHALEKCRGIPHGDAVSVGMVAAARLSVAQRMLKEKDAERIETLLMSMKLPTRMRCDKARIIDAIEMDKKRRGEKINFILLKGIGKPVIAQIGIEKLEEALDDMC